MSLKKLNLKWKKIDTIFISHTHADHVTGLPGILMLSSQVERSEALTIIGPPKIKDYIESSRMVLDMYINYEVLVEEIQEADKNGIVYETDDLVVRSVALNHSKVCVGYILEEKDRPGVFYPEKAKQAGVPCGPLWSRLQNGENVQLPDGSLVKPSDVMGNSRKGRKFSYVTDTAFVPGLSGEVSGSDLFICEGMFDHSLKASAREKKHLTSVQAARIAAEAGGIKQMGLIHYSPRYTERDLKNLLYEAKGIFPDTFLCRDRMRIEIPYEE